MGPVGELAGNRATVKRQRNYLNSGMADSERTQAEAIQRVLAEAQTASPDARMQAMQQAEDRNYGQAMQDAAGATLQGTGSGGRLPAEFTAAMDARGQEEAGRMSNIAREMARVRAPGDVAATDSIRRSGMSEALASLWNSSNQRSQAAQMDAQAVQTPWWGQVAGIVNRTAARAASAGGGK